jgi:nitrile hydratase subunit beta
VPGDGRGVHDLGGTTALGVAFGPIDTGDHDPSLFEKRVDALLMLLIHPDREVFTIDALRRRVEDMPQPVYDSVSYYDKWAVGIRDLLIERGVVTAAEVQARMSTIASALRAKGVAVPAERLP